MVPYSNGDQQNHMNSGQIAPSARLNALLRSLPLIALALSAVVALRQSYRAHRSVSENHPPDETPLPTPPPPVSIILPVRNEEAPIDACLASLLAQDYPDFDITIIDDGDIEVRVILCQERSEAGIDSGLFVTYRQNDRDVWWWCWQRGFFRWVIFTDTTMCAITLPECNYCRQSEGNQGEGSQQCVQTCAGRYLT